MERKYSEQSTLDDLPSEKSDPLMDHLKNVDAASGVGEPEFDLENQTSAPFAKSLTRADTAAWVTKHPSRIPDDGTDPLFTDSLTLFSYKKEGIDIYCGVRRTR